MRLDSNSVRMTANMWNFLSALLQDARFALRTLRKSLGFTCAALLTLALGIGANTAIYTIIDGVLLHPIPFAHPDRLVAMYQKTSRSRSEERRVGKEGRY